METNEFLEKPVKGLFYRYLVPSIIGTMVTSIYVLADTIIIGKGLGSVAMAALNIALPRFWDQGQLYVHLKAVVSAFS